MALRTPLYDWHCAHKAHMVEFGGWDMPVRYGTITDEHKAVRTAVGFFDISHMGRLVFQGPDAAEFLQHIFTNDVSSMNPGQVRYGLICNEKGGILDDVLVYQLETYWLMVVNASNREKITKWINKQKKTYAFEFLDETEAWAMVAVQGPDAHKIIENYAPLAAGLRYYYATTAMTEPGKVRIYSRTGYTGEDGWEIIVPAEEITPLVDELTKKVAKAAGVKLKPCGLGARDTLRLEAGMPLYGHELTEKIDPFQAGLGWAVKLNKGEFLGKEALGEHNRDNKKRPQRVGLELTGKRIAREGAAVKGGKKKVGTVTSGTFSPTLEKPIAMAYVNPEYTEPDTELQVDVRGHDVAARVVPLPFYKRNR